MGSLVLSLCALSLAVPEASALTRAQALIDDGKATDALQLLDARLVDGELSPADLARLWSLKARAYGLVGQGQQAQRAFAIALRIDPAWRLAASETDPEVRGPFHAALAALPSRSKALWAHVKLARSSEGSALTYALVADDLGLVATAELEAAGTREVVPLVPGPQRRVLDDRAEGPVTLRFLDEHRNCLREERLELSGGAASSEPPSASSGLRWLSLGGGAALAAGALGVMTSGIAWMTRDAGQKTGDGERELFLGGVLVGTGLVVVGGALIVTDFALDPP